MNPLIDEALQILVTGFDDYCNAFATITQRAGKRFENRDWQGMRQDTLERLDLHAKVVLETVGLLKRHLADRCFERPLWVALKDQYVQQLRQRCDAELACTFFNSINLKLFNTLGFDPELHISDIPTPKPDPLQDPELFHLQRTRSIDHATLKEILSLYRFNTRWRDLDRDARLCAQRIDQRLKNEYRQGHMLRIEMVRAPFFRGMSAYLVGCIHVKGRKIPLVFAIDSSESGLYVDALLTSDASLRILFSFSRSYFHVRTSCPSALVSFLRLLMPNKRLAEIYIGLGFHKHGKTELYRDLLDHQKVCSEDLFDFSPGKRGMVMIAFNMPNDDLIYKLIRDRFDMPKTTSAGQVMERYEYVFKHDRAGRLVDAQTFENLVLEDCCFTPRLLAEITDQAQKAVSRDRSSVLIHHAYVERRVTPLDIYLQEADAQDAKGAVLDYGQAIKDLAQINVFPGDMLIKNFGVTSLGRVVFYDYDELCRITECNFRWLPESRAYEDDLNDEPWFMVGPHDVFPEEFASFLGLPSDLRQIFLKHHGDLLTPEFWQNTQDQIHASRWTHIRPYGASLQLK